MFPKWNSASKWHCSHNVNNLAHVEFNVNMEFLIDRVYVYVGTHGESDSVNNNDSDLQKFVYVGIE